MGAIVTCSLRRVENLQAEQFIPQMGTYTLYVNGFQVNSHTPGTNPSVYTLQCSGGALNVEIGDWIARDSVGNPIVIPGTLFNTFFTTQFQYTPPPIMGPQGPPGPPGKDAVIPESTLRVMLETQQLERDHYRCSYLDNLSREHSILFNRNGNLTHDEWDVVISPSAGGPGGMLTHTANSWREAVDWVNRWITPEHTHV